MVYKIIFTALVAVCLLSSSFALPVEDQNPPQQNQPVENQNPLQPNQPQPEESEKPLEKLPQPSQITPLDSERPEAEGPSAPTDLESAPPATAEEKSDLDAANTFWGGYYGYRPYYGGWGGYGGGWRRGWGGYGYGRGFGYGGWGLGGGWGGGWGRRYYWG